MSPLLAQRWGNRPTSLWIAEEFGAARQADGETRSTYAASSIRRRIAAWAILLDSTCRSRKRVSALWMVRAVGRSSAASFDAGRRGIAAASGGNGRPPKLLACLRGWPQPPFRAQRGRP